MNSLRILIVEDDKSVIHSFATHIDTIKDLLLVAVTGNSADAIEAITRQKPDAVILDLELHNGGGTGFDVLNFVNKLEQPPYILITTNNTSKITFEHARSLGADFIMSKHQDNYSELAVLEFLNTMKPAIMNHCNNSDNKNSTASIEMLLFNRTLCELNAICMSPKLLGYKYLTDMIVMEILRSPSNLCQSVADKYGKSSNSIQRAASGAINQTWSRTEIEILLKHYNGSISHKNGSPTISEFVNYYALKIKSELDCKELLTLA